MNEIVLATSNQGKVSELQALLAPMQITVHSQAAFNVPPVEEDGLSFVENALKKARHCAKYTGLPALADDSGLVVDALNGAPGIYSARYAGADASDVANIVALLGALDAIPGAKRDAHFHCTLALVRHENDPDPLICQGRWYGQISQTPAGAGGFGYDPVFYVPEMQACAAELSRDDKNTHSHRGLAIAQLIQQLPTLLKTHAG